jgi:hypothetical protein
MRLQDPTRRYPRSALPTVRPLQSIPHDLRRDCPTAWELRAAFAIGGTDSESCPQNYSRLKTEAACASLAAIAGASMYAGSDEYYAYYPAGCFRHTISGKFYWNPHDRGANNSFAQPLCAGALHTPHCRHAGRWNT